MNDMSFFDAWHFLCDHPVFFHPEYNEMMSAFPGNVHIDVVKVNPETETCEDDPSLNTATRIWLETGGWVWDEYNQTYEYTHDHRLDCGGETFEDAILNLAHIVGNQK